MPLQIFSGQNIRSPNVDPNRQYAARSVDNLQALGALQPGEAELLHRVDGIIDNRPVDGKADIDELVRIEQPDYRAALFADEQRAQPALWRHLEWGPVAPALPAPQLPALAARDISVLPAGLNFGIQFPINQLPAEIQRSAMRVQLVLNEDADAQTISLQDLEQAMAAPGRFTAQDVRDFQRADTFIRDFVRQAGAQMSARIEVPEPGERRLQLPHPGQVGFELITQTELQELRSYTPGTNSNGFRNSLEVTRATRLEVEVPAGSQALLINLASGEEVLLAAGRHRSELPRGTYRVERWENGNRMESSEVNVPDRPPSRVDLGRYLGYGMVTAGGQPLQRSPVSAQTTVPRYAGGQTTHTARFVWDTQARAPGGAVDQQALRQVEPAPIRLPVGRYEVQLPRHGQIALDVFPGGVLRATLPGGAVVNLTPTQLNAAKYFESQEAAQHHKRVYFDPAKSELVVADRNPRDTNYERLVVSAAHRMA